MTITPSARQAIEEFATRLNKAVRDGAQVNFELGYMNETYKGILKEMLVHSTSSKEGQINLEMVLERRRYLFKNVIECTINENPGGQKNTASLCVQYIMGNETSSNDVLLSW